MTKNTTLAIVDDDESILHALSSLARSAGYNVTLFKSAEEFLQNFQTSRPDCVLTDLQMPGMNGLELQHVLRASASSPPVIFMTAFSDEAARESAMAAGAHDFFDKTCDSDIILRSIAAALHEG